MLVKNNLNLDKSFVKLKLGKANKLNITIFSYFKSQVITTSAYHEFQLDSDIFQNISQIINGFVMEN